jgi:hypothetical protein
VGLGAAWARLRAGLRRPRARKANARRMRDPPAETRAVV